MTARAIARRPSRKISAAFRDVTPRGAVPLTVAGTTLPARVFTLNALRVLITTDPPDGLLHLSISHPSRYPSWDEIAHARYTLLPLDRTFVMYLPPPDEYVNIEGGPRAGNVFHLHELPEATA